MNQWTVGNAAFPTLTAAVIHSAYHRVPMTRYGKPVEWSAFRKDGRTQMVTARWAR